MNRDLVVILPLITAAVTLVLNGLLRAVLAPLLLLGAILSTGAALGLSTLVFRALGFPHTDPTVLLFGLLFLSRSASTTRSFSWHGPGGG